MRRIVLIAWLLLPGAALVAQQANPAASVGPPRFTISGTVVNANGGQPIAHAQVNIQSVDGRGTWTARGDDVGRFAFAGIAPGKYLLAGEAHGFVRQAYDEHEGFSSAIVAGPGLVSEGLVFRLKPEAVITVKVRDEFEEPVRNGMATLFREAVEEGQYKVQVRAMAGLNDEGSCTFAHLPAGKYFVAIKARPWYAQPGLAPAGPSRNSGLFDATYPITYYSDATDAAAATAIPLQPGERALADMSLRAVPAARLEISLPPGLTGTQQSARLEQPSFNGFRMPVDGLNVRNTQDHIELSGFAPGHYILNLDSFPPQRVRTGLAGDPRFPLQQAKSGLAGDPGFGDRSRSSRYREIDVAGVTEIDGSEAEVYSAVSGAVSFEGTPGVPPQAFLQLVNSRSAQALGAPISAAGEFALQGDLAPGSYQVRVANAPGFVTKSVSATGAKVQGTTVEIRSGEPVRRSVAAVSTGLAKVEGVALRGKQPAAGAMVVLVPLNPAASVEWFRRDQSDSDGTFTLAAVLPGDYTVIAVNDWTLQWASRRALQPYVSGGQRLHVEANKQYRASPQVQ